ncbi:MAG: exo-alpha-sialidase [Chloroflexi bacterium]|nr:exo-alpha-sialidase [Chloroflexota bacterium]
MKSKVASFFRVLATLAIGASLVPALVRPAPAVAGNQAWTDISDPTRLNLGAIKAIAFAPDGLTGFAFTTIGTSGSSDSTLIKTTNGGVSWSAVGLFDAAGSGQAVPQANLPSGLKVQLTGAAVGGGIGGANAKTIIRVSTKYATDATVVVAVAGDDNTTGAADIVNQVFWSKDGGATFTQVGGDIAAGTAQLITDMAMSDQFNGSSFVKDTVIVVTAVAANDTRGNLFRLRGSASSPSWSVWGPPVEGDYYAIKFFPGSAEEVMVIAAADTDGGGGVGDGPAADAATIYEYRLNIAETTANDNLNDISVTAGSATPSRTGFFTTADAANAVAQSATAGTELNIIAAIALPDNWSQSTSSDREVITIDLDVGAIGGASRGTIAAAAAEGLVARRGTGAGALIATLTVLGNTQGAAEDGYTSLAMSGNATTGFALAGTDDGGVLRSTNGGQTWSTVAKGITDDVDGTAGLTTVAVVSSSGFMGNGGLRGGVWYSTNKGSGWKSGGAYSDDLDDEYRSIARTSDGTWFLVGMDNVSGVTSVFKATSTKAFYRVNRHASTLFARPAPDFATSQTVYVGVGAGAITGQVLKSTDGGETFATTQTDPDQVGTTDKNLSLGTAGVLGGDLVVLDKDTVIVAFTTGLVALSTDGGATWTHSTSNPSAAFTRIRVSPDGTKLLGITTTRVVYYSSNKGITWSQIGATVGAAGTGRDVAFDPGFDSNSYIYAAVNGSANAVWRINSKTATTTTAWDGLTADINPGIAGAVGQTDGYILGFDSTGTLWVASFADADADGAYDAGEASFVASTFDPKEAAVTWRTVPTGNVAGAFGAGNDTAAVGTLVAVRDMIIYGNPPTIVVISDEGGNNDMNSITDTSAAPVQTSPANKSTGQPRALALQWNAVPDATIYDARIGLTADPQLTGAGAYTGTDQLGVETTSQYAGDGMIVGGTFNWKVREAAPLTSRWSPVWSFTVGTPTVTTAPTPPTTTVPTTAAPIGVDTILTGYTDTTTISGLFVFSNTSKTFASAIPGAPARSLTSVSSGQILIIQVEKDVTLTIGGQTYVNTKGTNYHVIK